jgi:hypothetical protein
MSDYELFIETDEGIKRLTSPPKSPPKRTVGPEPLPKLKAEKKEEKELKNGDTDKA